MRFSGFNTTSVSCAELFRCYSSNFQHRFTTNPFYCSSKDFTYKEPNVGYTSFIHIPSVTEPLFEMMNPTSKRLVMSSSIGRDVAIRLGYTVINKITYVFSIPFISSIPYVLIWAHCNQSHSDLINTLVTPLNSEYSSLMSAGWFEMATFFMFPNPRNTGVCSLLLDDTRKSVSFTQNRNGVDTCRLSYGYKSVFL